MSGKPAARITDPTACPIPGHGTNPIASGSPDVMFDGLAAARLTDKSACGGGIASNVSATVFINGLNAAFLGSVGDHGNVVVGGSSTVLIGNSGGGAAFSAITPLYRGRFRLIDSETGQPIAGRKVQISSTGGKQESGITDAEGFTQWVMHETQESLSFTLLEGGR